MKLEAPKELPSVVERARLYLQRCPPAVSGQFGHKATFRVACLLVQGFALSEAEALGLLREWNQTCRPPWSEAELAYKVASALAAPSKNPIGYLREGKHGSVAAAGTTAVAPAGEAIGLR